MKKFFALFSLAAALPLFGCSLFGETMVLLDEEIVQIGLAPSNGAGEMNDEYNMQLTESKDIKAFEQAVTSAVKKKGTADLPVPDYDIAVEYKEGFPPHGLHLWLGDPGDKSFLMYVTDDGGYYETTGKATEILRSLIEKNE